MEDEANKLLKQLEDFILRAEPQKDKQWFLDFLDYLNKISVSY